MIYDTHLSGGSKQGRAKYMTDLFNYLDMGNFRKCCSLMGLTQRENNWGPEKKWMVQQIKILAVNPDNLEFKS